MLLRLSSKISILYTVIFNSVISIQFTIVVYEFMTTFSSIHLKNFIFEHVYHSCSELGANSNIRVNLELFSLDYGTIFCSEVFFLQSTL